MPPPWDRTKESCTEIGYLFRMLLLFLFASNVPVEAGTSERARATSSINKNRAFSSPFHSQFHRPEIPNRKRFYLMRATTIYKVSSIYWMPFACRTVGSLYERWTCIHHSPFGPLLLFLFLLYSKKNRWRKFAGSMCLIKWSSLRLCVCVCVVVTTLNA